MNKSVVLSGSAISKVNSVTYTDIAGLYAGLDRFPGETSEEFLRRVERAAVLDRSAGYEGFLNQLNLQFGLEPVEAFRVSSSGTEFSLSVSLEGVSLVSQQESILVPTRTVDPDNFWMWRKISEIVADINASRTFTADLLKDGPSIQLPRQTNSRQVRNYPVQGASFVLPDFHIDTEKILFNVAVPNWVVMENGRTILFDRAVPDGTTVTYEYRLCPYSAVAYPATAISLTDPAMRNISLSPDGEMIYQVREYLYSVAEQDRSYWGK